MASAKRKSNGSRKNLATKISSPPGQGVSPGTFMRRFWHPIHRAEELRPGEAKPHRDHERAFYALPWREWNTSCRRISLPASRHAALRRLGRRRLHPLRVSRLAV